MRPAIFFDRDGVLNKALVRDGRPLPPRMLSQLVIDVDSVRAVSELKKKGFLLICVTNQPDLKMGLLSASELDAINKCVASTYSLDKLYACVHLDSDNCDCRKPKPGMVMQAIKDFQIDIKSSFVIGDRWRDVEMAHSVGMKSYFIDYQYKERRPLPPFMRVTSLIDAVSRILEI